MLLFIVNILILFCWNISRRSLHFVQLFQQSFLIVFSWNIKRFNILNFKCIGINQHHFISMLKTYLFLILLLNQERLWFFNLLWLSVNTNVVRSHCIVGRFVNFINTNHMNYSDNIFKHFSRWISLTCNSLNLNLKIRFSYCSNLKLEIAQQLWFRFIIKTILCCCWLEILNLNFTKILHIFLNLKVFNTKFSLQNMLFNWFHLSNFNQIWNTLLCFHSVVGWKSQLWLNYSAQQLLCNVQQLDL